MSFQPPTFSARQFSVSGVWPCSSCSFLARSDTSASACPNCGHIGRNGNNADSVISPQGLHRDAHGIDSDSMLSETVRQDGEPFVAGSPDPSTLFIPANEEQNDDFLLKIRSCLSAEITINFGGFPDDLSGGTASGYLIKASRPLTKQEMANLENSLNSDSTDNYAADNNLSDLPLSSNIVDILASASATLSFKAEQQESREIVDPSSNRSKEPPAISKVMPAPDIKISDAKALEPMDTRYILITKPQRFFKIGRVFMTLWSEPASSTARDGPNFSSSTIGGRIFSETRRFVVVQSRHGYALCCPIQTYQKRGTTKSQINVENHALVYAAGSEPKLLAEEELPGMGRFSIVIEDKSVTVDQSSRLNFGKVYTVEHNIKVRNIGKIDRESLPRLKAALVKSMGVSVSDGEEAETGTETEDNVPRPTLLKTQPEFRSGDKKSSSIEFKSSPSSGPTKASSSGNKSHYASNRKSIFFIKGEGIDREVITTDICRYLGNDALVKPGSHQDSYGRSDEGYYITAYRPPTSEQIADLRNDSQKWREERQSGSRSQVPYSQSATRQAAMSSDFASEIPFARSEYASTAYRGAPSSQPPDYSNFYTPPQTVYGQRGSPKNPSVYGVAQPSPLLSTTTYNVPSLSSFEQRGSPAYPSIYGAGPSSQPQSTSNYYDSPQSGFVQSGSVQERPLYGYGRVPKPFGTGTYYSSPAYPSGDDYMYGSPGYSNPGEATTIDNLHQPKTLDEDML